MITKTSFKNMPNYKDMIENDDFSQPGVFGKDTAIRFNSNDSKCKYLSFESNDDWVLSTFTISAWINNTPGNYSVLICRANTYSACYITYNTNALPYMAGSLSGPHILSTKTYNYNEWTHIVYVRDASKNHYMFINGELVNTTFTSDALDNYETWDNKVIAIGDDIFQGGTTFFYGLMDDLVVTKDVLYTSNFTVPDKPMAEMFPSTEFILNLYQVGPYGGITSNLKVY